MRLTRHFSNGSIDEFLELCVPGEIAMRALDGNEARVVQRSMIQAERPLFGEAEFMGAAELRMKGMPPMRGFRFLEMTDELRSLRLRTRGIEIILEARGNNQLFSHLSKSTGP